MSLYMCVFVCVPQRELVPDDYSYIDPEHKLIYRFVRTLFSAAQLTAECAIVTLVSVFVYCCAEILTLVTRTNLLLLC